MGSLDYLSIGLIIFLSYLIVYSLINRICVCIERCSVTKHCGNLANNETVKKSDRELKPKED